MTFTSQTSFFIPELLATSEKHSHNNDRLHTVSQILFRQEELHRDEEGKKKYQCLAYRSCCDNLSRMICTETEEMNNRHKDMKK